MEFGNVVPHTKLCDHENKDGEINWETYHAAESANGEKCRQCGKFILFATGHPTSCDDCKGLDAHSTTQDADHGKFVRCPACGHTMDTNDEMHELYEEGEHEVYCGACDYQFEISTQVSFTFTSPPMLAEEEREAWVKERED